jgi:hypothetical protein
VERNFGTAQDRLVKGMRVAGVKTIAEANRYLAEDYLVWWQRELTVEPAHRDDAHRRLEKEQLLAAALSHVEMRQVRNDYTLRFQGETYQIEQQAIVSRLRGADVRMEKRLDGTMAVRFGERYLSVVLCPAALKTAPAAKPAAAPRPGKGPNAGRKSKWMEGFFKKSGPSLKKAFAKSNATS